MTERAVPDRGRVLERDRRRGVAGWADVRGRRLGGWAFILNRLAGLGVLAYLYLHLLVLSQLAVGPQNWDSILENWFRNPVVLAGDVFLLAGLLLHGLNGIRVTLVGFGMVIDRQKALLIALAIVGAIVLLVGGLRLVAEAGVK